MQERSRNGAVIALGVMMLLGQASRAEAKTSTKKDAFIGLLTAKADSAQASRLAKRLERESTQVERQISNQQRALTAAIRQLAKLRPNPANHLLTYYKSRVRPVIERTNRLTAQLQQLANLVSRYSSIAPGPARRHVTRENQLALASIPLYSRVTTFARVARIERSVATPFAPSSAL